ncbi:hypothetical protein ABFX02_06G121300 [Erythranthe guttata]
MAKPSLLFALAATILSLATAAFSANAAAVKPHKLTHSLQAAPPPRVFGYHPHQAPPHSKKNHRLIHAHPPAAVPPTISGERGALPPEPYQGFYEFTDRCLDKLTEECGLEIFQGIFWEDEVTEISRKCCQKLVAVGRSCHEGLLKATMKLPGLPKREKSVVKRRDAQLWSNCVSIIGVPHKFSGSPSPSP